ncbi:MAG: hypothetical protein EBS68_10340 [Rhodobacteraceae bacterium]|nr:hypothetical protein [Paracoccaceae bacterium]
MSTPVPHTQIERTILTVLEETKPYLVPRKVLFGHTSTAAVRPITEAEFDAALDSLVKKEPPQIVALKTDDATKYKITAAGEARLLE